jgi:hypothetical protein
MRTGIEARSQHKRRGYRVRSQGAWGMTRKERNARNDGIIALYRSGSTMAQANKAYDLSCVAPPSPALLITTPVNDVKECAREYEALSRASEDLLRSQLKYGQCDWRGDALDTARAQVAGWDA